ncbi:heme-binding domain-containing protein [Granulicella sp. S190]|uniref:heme-binding domain-containing protein n=1 Tax=Granulicella sp. S190 TaxID=1747226 RepID=UPI00131B23D8|nr:heme-binding domain-containing protein [Granulicella sp. S190]
MKHQVVIIVLSAVVVVGSGFVHPFGNPRVAPPKGLDTLLVQADMPANAKKILMTKCADCHSNETRWPVYARVAPGSWLIERDIVEARKKMNLSLWDQKSPDDQEVMIGEIIHEAKNGEMPPLQYRLLHWKSQLTTTDVATLSDMQKSGPAHEGTGSTGDATRGKIVFERRCTGCHTMEQDREGPRLGGVFGRKAGSVTRFNYSAGLKNSGITWNETTLEKWLSDPDVMVPDNNMGVGVPKAQERSDLIAYFKQKK